MSKSIDEMMSTSEDLYSYYVSLFGGDTMKWTKQEIGFLINEYPDGDIQKLSENLNKSVSSIYNKSKRLKLSKNIVGIKNPNFNPDSADYDTLHAWVNRQLTKPLYCPICNKIPKVMDLCYKNHSFGRAKGKYSRDLNMWEFLCRSCHMKKDNRIRNIWGG